MTGIISGATGLTVPRRSSITTARTSIRFGIGAAAERDQHLLRRAPEVGLVQRLDPVRVRLLGEDFVREERRPPLVVDHLVLHPLPHGERHRLEPGRRRDGLPRLLQRRQPPVDVRLGRRIERRPAGPEQQHATEHDARTRDARATASFGANDSPVWFSHRGSSSVTPARPRSRPVRNVCARVSSASGDRDHERRRRALPGSCRPDRGGQPQRRGGLQAGRGAGRSVRTAHDRLAGARAGDRLGTRHFRRRRPAERRAGPGARPDLAARQGVRRDHHPGAAPSGRAGPGRQRRHAAGRPHRRGGGRVHVRRAGQGRRVRPVAARKDCPLQSPLPDRRPQRGRRIRDSRSPTARRARRARRRSARSRRWCARSPRPASARRTPARCTMAPARRSRRPRSRSRTRSSLARLAARGPITLHLVLEDGPHGDAASFNVLAELRGRERPDEIVVIGAHLDSWDVGEGAQDDGAGCAIAMESLATLRRLDLVPRRTIRARALHLRGRRRAGGQDLRPGPRRESSRTTSPPSSPTSAPGRRSGSASTPAPSPSPTCAASSRCWRRWAPRWSTPGSPAPTSPPCARPVSR